MVIETWVIYAVIMAVSWAAAPLINQIFKAESAYLLFWTRVFVVIGSGAIAFSLFELPTDPMYYVYIFGTAVFFSYFDLIYFSQAAKSGAGVATRVESLSVGMTFVLWTLISPALIADYAAHPLRSGGIIAALIGSIYFTMRMKKCSVSKGALKVMLPAIVCSAIGTVLATKAMQHCDPAHGAWYYAFVQSAYCLFIYLATIKVPALRRHLKLPDIAFFDRRTMQAAAFMALAWLVNTPMKYLAIGQVENPAYVTAIGLTTPFWVLVIYKLMRHRENADILSGIGIVACAILLVFFTRF